ncbi:MAG: hypothetical protein HY000_28965 [Planctomycetes bacterium]|nr:hypothetical protein [Planctomycetota bacterium]
MRPLPLRRIAAAAGILALLALSASAQDVPRPGWKSRLGDQQPAKGSAPAGEAADAEPPEYSPEAGDVLTADLAEPLEDGSANFSSTVANSGPSHVHGASGPVHCHHPRRSCQRRRGHLNSWKNHWNYHRKPRLQEKYWGYPEEFCEPPLGYFVNAHVATQLSNGEAARMVLFHYDFIDGGANLKPRGKRQLAKIAKLLTNLHPIVIEASADAALDESRRQAVLSQLAETMSAVPDERVQVGFPLSRGLEGAEAVLIYERFYGQLSAGAPPGGAAAPAGAPSPRAPNAP